MDNKPSDTYNYSFTRDDSGKHVVRSIVNIAGTISANDKDAVSFYNNFSRYSHVDTGLLPLNGTGVLAIRSAGPHMQITVQHAPGIYYVNWGDHEGSPTAKTYSVAQPYRVIVGDFVNGNLLGARTFYSPYPITHPDMPLYHVNLPNINCKGYRGNAVGWICLYHNQDWTHLPFNEKISYLIERCSGVETYNDANMSETDGPRFYAAHYLNASSHAHLWNPALWQDKSVSEGFEWTLDENIWIPVKVTSMDEQSKHDPNGIPLTVSMALLGNYRAYYSDNEVPKAYNVFARSDLYDAAQKDAMIGKYFKAAFAESSIDYTPRPVDNPIVATINAREDKSHIIAHVPEPEPEPQTWECECCEETKSVDDDEIFKDADNQSICQNCVDDCYVYVESVGEYYHQDCSDLIYDDSTQAWYHTEYDTIVICNNCSHLHAYSGLSPKDMPSSVTFTYENNGKAFDFCSNCIELVFNEESMETGQKFTISSCMCKSVSYVEELVDRIDFGLVYHSYINPVFTFDNDAPSNTQYNHVKKAICTRCMHYAKNMGYAMYYPYVKEIHQIGASTICPCGLMTDPNNIEKCSSTLVKNGETFYDVNACCVGCTKGTVQFAGTPDEILPEYQPFDQEILIQSIKHKVIEKSPFVQTTNTLQTTNTFGSDGSYELVYDKTGPIPFPKNAAPEYMQYIPPDQHFTD
jgi:hypothetical protein